MYPCYVRMLTACQKDLEENARMNNNKRSDYDNQSSSEAGETCQNMTAVVLILITIIAIIFLFWLQNTKYHISVSHGNNILLNDK